jgi:hypothetical protein
MAQLIREVSLATLLCSFLSPAGCSAGEPAGGVDSVELKTIRGFNDSHAKQMTKIFAFQRGRLSQRFLQMNEQQIELSIARHD